MHPHKFTLWVAMGSLIMMFAGLTSAFIVKSNQASWKPVTLPSVFWFSTVAIVVSSITMYLAVRAIRAQNLTGYRSLLLATLILGTKDHFDAALRIFYGANISYDHYLTSEEIREKAKVDPRYKSQQQRMNKYDHYMQDPFGDNGDMVY